MNDESKQPYQARVHEWLTACLGAETTTDRAERHHRFLEEALELAQSTGCSREEVLQLVEYVYARPVGEPEQEVGGVMVTLASLCTANGLDLARAAETELSRAWDNLEKIRAKRKTKPLIVLPQ